MARTYLSISSNTRISFEETPYIRSQTDLSNAKLEEAYFSKGYLRGM